MYSINWLWFSLYLLIGLAFALSVRRRSPEATGGPADAFAYAVFIFLWWVVMLWAVVIVIKKRSARRDQ